MRLLSIFLLCVPLWAQLSSEQKQLNLDSFETVWTTVRDKHWETRPGGLDWEQIHAEYRPLIEKAESIDQARRVMRTMLARLKQTHFGIMPWSVVQSAATGAGSGAGWPGFDVRVLDGRVIAINGDLRGGEVISVDSLQLRDLVIVLSPLHELERQRAIEFRLAGRPGDLRHFVFEEVSGTRIDRDIQLYEPPGTLSGFGRLPPQPVVFETKRIGNVGYARLNIFLDVVGVLGSFGKFTTECADCDGMIIDLRGNPGGVGAMAMGMAGWLVERQGQRLGVMHMRGAKLNFAINPRPGAYKGPVAVLVDGSSASTSEIFAGGLQDLKRARIFGTHTAGAALPSVIGSLPNGDGFQYAIANYFSEGGKALEGAGVTPDEEVVLTRAALAAGGDPVIDAALNWIRGTKK